MGNTVKVKMSGVVCGHFAVQYAIAGGEKYIW